MSEHWDKEADFSKMLGEILTSIQGLEVGSERVTFETASGRTFVLYHSQDCCESVTLNDITGDVADLVGSPLTMADESSNSDQDKPAEYAESWTWTFYKLATVKGYVTLRWLGESNGYYSESVTFFEDSPHE